MATESVTDRNTPVCVYYSKGRCEFRRGVDTPSLSEIQGGRLITFDRVGRELVGPAQKTEILCKGRLKFEAYRGIYQKANCNEYAVNEPKIKFT